MRKSFQTSAYILTIFAAVFIGCSSGKTAPGSTSERFDQQLFETPDALVAAVKSAADNADSDALYKILGPDGQKLIFSGDPVSDRLELQLLSRRMNERADLVPYVSPEFPNASVMKLRIGRMGVNAGIPLVNEGKGWRTASRYFAPRSVKRRMASNEIEVWRACLEYVEAQREYVLQDRNADGVLEYAQQLISTPGKRDGLYWEVAPGEKNSPLGEVIAKANSQGYVAGSKGSPRPFNGYLFKILTRQGKAAREGARDYMVDGRMTKGFALVAYPAEWGAGGVRTFVVGPDGIIHSKNLGISTEKLVEDMQELNPDRSWAWVQRPQVNEFEEYMETL